MLGQDFQFFDAQVETLLDGSFYRNPVTGAIKAESRAMNAVIGTLTSCEA